MGAPVALSPGFLIRRRTINDTNSQGTKPTVQHQIRESNHPSLPRNPWPLCSLDYLRTREVRDPNAMQEDNFFFFSHFSAVAPNTFPPYLP